MAGARTVAGDVGGGGLHDRYQEGREAFWLSWKDVEVAGRPAAYGEAGEGTPVVFLHGWGLDHRVYKRALARLVAAGVRVVAPALPGFGGTASLRARSWSLAGFASWLAEFLDAVGVTEPALIVGHSFGGGVGIVFAHDHPERVRGLVLINSIGASAWAGRGHTARTMAQRPLWDWGLHFPGDLWPLAQARRVLPVILAEAVPNLVRDPRAFWRVAALARDADLTGELEELKSRRLPVVVLWGKRDRIITRDAFEEMCEVLGGPHSFTVEGSHAWLIADPDTFGEVMTNVVDIAMRSRRLGRKGRPVRELPTLVGRLGRPRPAAGRSTT
ncbi:MAG TPA: alpha/beta fold hydrolase [Acidimicrobiales bacterium]|nr:alpha/beta fold hydrolase [Acidimicrobiales bacterium]